MERHKRQDPQLSAFNYNYPPFASFLANEGGFKIFPLFLPSFPRIEGGVNTGSSPSFPSPPPRLLGERQAPEGGDGMKRL